MPTQLHFASILPNKEEREAAREANRAYVFDVVRDFEGVEIQTSVQIQAPRIGHAIRAIRSLQGYRSYRFIRLFYIH